MEAEINQLENLSRRPTTVLTQSSTYNAQTASIANDGDVHTDDLNCAHTAPNNEKAWLQVDFGESYSINNVKIYYRRDGDGHYNWKQYRFRQFYLDVSNSSATQTPTSLRTRCYKDNTTAPNLPPNIIDIPCKRTARSVIVETTYDPPEDDRDGEHGAILEICEIEVYGCETTCRNNVCDGFGNCTDGCVDGYWGPPACNFKCPADCKEPNCIMYNGHCNSCKSGYWGNTCISQCPINCIGRVCDKSSGTCTQGCTSGRYGDTCNITCSPWCVGGTCDKQSATCFNGCVQNWSGSQCDECDSNHYGSSCSLVCNSNCVNYTCNDTDGICSLGCKTGFHGDVCDRQCTSSCPSGCDRSTGQCNGDCPVGKFGEFCNKFCNQGCEDRCMRYSGICTNCIDGMFGDVCDGNCSSCPTGCDRISGRCGGDCPAGKFGEFCNKTCSQHCRNGCIRLTGSCNDGCTVGKLGDFCNETCDARHETCCSHDTCARYCTQSPIPNTEHMSSLYAVITVFCISLLVNIFTITWIFRNKACKSQDVNQEEKKDTDSISTPGIYDTAEENAGYQELGQLSGPSHYDHLQGPATNK
ncbi:multiple epidermal growth factor-like domains protein 6 [Magallana gigas]|uniref:multiple epidermal growth factor-like domains protein 6 n=1 Tax=Magallana gigas TaxID=29159 RepID=UPI003340FFC9